MYRLLKVKEKLNIQTATLDRTLAGTLAVAMADFQQWNDGKLKKNGHLHCQGTVQSTSTLYM